MFKYKYKYIHLKYEYKYLKAVLEYKYMYQVPRAIGSMLIHSYCCLSLWD